MQLIDTHAHLTSPELFPHLEEVLERAKAASIHRIINVCTDLESLKHGFEIEKKHVWIKNAGATHPHDVEKEGKSAFETFARAARSHELVAIGEIGLDYHYHHSSKADQQKFFIDYLHLAAESRLPVIIHCREAFDDLYPIMDAEYPKKAPAILHCFSGSRQEAFAGIDRGWMISLSGIITFKKSDALKEVVRELPLESLLIETDAPFLAPQSHRGKTNEPALVCETAQALADIKDLSIEEIAAVTTANAMRIFQLKP